MNIADTLRGFARRWYIVLPGIILAVIAGLGTYLAVQPGHERTATQLLLPGSGIVPVGTTNPYLFLGGLTQAADIVVRVMRSDEVVGPLVKDYPGTTVVVERDPTVSGPVIQITVTGKTDAATEQVLTAAVTQTEVEMDRLQTQQKVADKDRITVSTLTLDRQSTLQQKTRILLTAGTALGIAVFVLILASLIDGLTRRSHKAGRRGKRVDRRRAARKRETAVPPAPDGPLDDLPAQGGRGMDHGGPDDGGPDDSGWDDGETEHVDPRAGMETAAGRVSADERGVAIDDSGDDDIDGAASVDADESSAGEEEHAPGPHNGETVGAARSRAHDRAARRT